MRKLGDGLLFGFGEPCTFKPGSAGVPPVLEERAAELAEVLGHYPYMVLVEGFTDDAFKPTARFPDPESLALARAAAVADIMTDATGLEPEKVLVAGPGNERPVADNATALGRQANRRVEIRVLTLEASRATWLKSEHRRAEAEALEAAEEAD